MTTTEEALDLAAIQARVDAATPGPWTAVDSNDDHTNPMWQVYDNVYIRPSEYDQDTPYMSALIENSETGRADADFIAAARSDIPALLDLIEIQSRQIAEAPHSEGCASLLPPPNDLPAWLCTCWKAGL